MRCGRWLRPRPRSTGSLRWASTCSCTWVAAARKRRTCWPTQGATLVGVAHLDLEGAAGGSAELAVHPEHRRAGLGTELVRELLAEAAGRRCAAALGARRATRRPRAIADPPRPAQGPRALPAPAGHDRAARRSRRCRPACGSGRSGSASTSRSSCGSTTPPSTGTRSRAAGRRRDQPARARSRGSTRTASCWPSTRRRPAARLPLDQGAPGRRLDPTTRWARSTCSAWTRPRAGCTWARALTLAGLRHLYERGLRTVLLYVEADNEAAVAALRGLGFTRWDTDVMYAR